MLSKHAITILINRRRAATLLINIERLQNMAKFFDWFYESHWEVPADQVPPYVYRHWYQMLLSLPKNTKSVLPRSNSVTIYCEERDHEWLLSQLLE